MGANPGTDAYVNCRTQVAGHRSSASAAIAANDLCQVWKRLGRPRIALELEERIRKALATPARPGVRVVAKQFVVDPGTVQRISRPFDGGVSVARRVVKLSKSVLATRIMTPR